ncbi:hypothetical protein AB0269_10930 [Microbacterium sp. NPDC077644]|uniref:hypothetical protein n=1 Tax=Microbacterium sp. NPDC077644 TaxID=3155055 RepID=UPI0034509946
MDDPLDLFAAASPEPEPERPASMTDAQRGEIRGLFAKLGKTTAHEQFALVDELIGVRLQRVTDLTSSNASLLVHRLRQRVDSQTRISTGNAWTDREEDTWIDRL